MQYIRDYDELELPVVRLENPVYRPKRGVYDYRQFFGWATFVSPSTIDWEDDTKLFTHFMCAKHELTLYFGKYKGHTYEWIAKNDTSYAVWLVNNADRLTEQDRRYMGWLIYMQQKVR